jgi:hypothetical protein
MATDNVNLFRDWREKQAAEIKARDQASEVRRRETIAKAERAIDQFYDEYAAKTKRNIRENKCVRSWYQLSDVVNQICILEITRQNFLHQCLRPFRLAQPGRGSAVSSSCRIRKARH